MLLDGREVQYRYGKDGELVAVDDGNWPLAFQYDAQGLLKTEHLLRPSLERIGAAF